MKRPSRAVFPVRLSPAEYLEKRIKDRKNLRKEGKPLLNKHSFKKTVKAITRKSTGCKEKRFQHGVVELLTSYMQDILHRIFVNAGTSVSINGKKRLTCKILEFTARAHYPDIIKINRLTSNGEMAYRYLRDESIIYGSEKRK